MPPRSKVITILPEYIRQEVERRLFENGFRDYQGLAQWETVDFHFLSSVILSRSRDGAAVSKDLAAHCFAP